MLIRHYDHLKNTDDEWDERHDDLFRAGIVLSVAAMDAYFTDRFCEEFTTHIAKNNLNNEMRELVEKAGLNTEKSISMFNKDRPNRILSNMVKKYLSGRVTQNFKEIDKLYGCFGFKKFTQHAEKLTKRKNLLQSINKLIERRHKIVHAGDYNQHGNLRTIEYTSLVRKIIEVEKLVESCDGLLRLKKAQSKNKRKH